MACNFSIPFSGSAEDIVQKARVMITRQGGTFTGDTSAGTIEVSAMGSTVKGSYTIVGSALDIVITSKPIFVPCGTIEGFLKGKLAG